MIELPPNVNLDSALSQALSSKRALPSQMVGSLLGAMLGAPQARPLPLTAQETLGKDAIRQAIARSSEPLELLEAIVPPGWALADGLVEGQNIVDGLPVLIRRGL